MEAQTGPLKKLIVINNSNSSNNRNSNSSNNSNNNSSNDNSNGKVFVGPLLGFQLRLEAEKLLRNPNLELGNIRVI